MREWPNRTVSKTVVPHGYRGFESHSLRHRVGWPVASLASDFTAEQVLGRQYLVVPATGKE